MTDKPDPKPAVPTTPPTEGEFKAFVGRILSVPKPEADRRQTTQTETPKRQ